VGLPGLTEGFEAVYVDEDGVEQRVPWGWLPEVVGGLGRPVRSFPSYRGQRNFPGWYWSTTQGRRIGFESWVERNHLVALDFDPSVVGIVSQPFWLLWPGRWGQAAPARAGLPGVGGGRRGAGAGLAAVGADRAGRS
jgi:hypothetical protein